MDDEVEDRLADRINREPMVYMDCTQSELAGAGLIGAGAGIPGGILVGFVLLGSVLIGLILGLIALIAIAYFMLIRFKNNREKYHPSWRKERLFLRKRELGIGGSIRFADATKFYRRGARRGR